jgi:hypothetical protein
VWSQDVFYYLKSAPLPITANVLDYSIEQALHSGTVGDHVYDFDLGLVNLNQYKAIVFMNDYKLSDTQRDFIKKKVAKNGRTIVWNYLTGYSDGEKLDFNFVKSLTGINAERLTFERAPEVHFLKPDDEYKFSGAIEPLFVVKDDKAEALAELKDSHQTLIARKRLKDFISVYCAVPLNGTNHFREIFRKAGCHIYNEDDDFIYANSGLLILHTKDGGRRDITLKSGKQLNVDLKRGSTVVFDSITGAEILK